MKTQTMPRVNINGTSRAELIEQQQAVIMATRVLLRALHEALPHGRDYQTAPDGAFAAAREQWLKRLSRAAKTEAEATAIAEFLAEGAE